VEIIGEQYGYWYLQHSPGAGTTNCPDSVITYLYPDGRLKSWNDNNVSIFNGFDDECSETVSDQQTVFNYAKKAP
jgi:hypothetical protein